MEQKQHLLPRRSLKACTSLSWRTFALHPLDYLRASWPYLLLVGMAGSFFFEMVLDYATSCALPALRLYETGGQAELAQFQLLPTLPQVAYLVLALIVWLFSLNALGARMVVLISEETGSTDFRPLPLRYNASHFRALRRLWTINGVWATGLVLATALIVWTAAKWTPWLLCLLPLLYIYSWTTCNCTRMVYALCGLSFAQSFRFGLRRSLGIAGLLQAVTLLPLLLIACICWQPLLVHGATAWAAADTLLRGDEASMPDLLPLLYFVCATLGISFTALIGTLRTYALGLYCKDRTTGNGAA